LALLLRAGPLPSRLRSDLYWYSRVPFFLKMSISLLIKDHPYRSIALVTSSHALVLHHSPTAARSQISGNASSISSILGASTITTPRCVVEFLDLSSAELVDYHSLSGQSCLGALGLIALNGDVFLGVVTGAREVAAVRPGENVLRIHAVNFCELSSPPSFYLDTSLS
jgi:hypothetical protein